MSDEIRFITSDYKEKFRIPDNSYIVITQPDGEQAIHLCKRLGETHFELSGECFHICQFAEIMERNGSQVAPETEPEFVGSYKIIRRVPVGSKVFVIGHSPDAVQPYATWQGYRDKPDKDWEHYFSARIDARHDLVRRVHAERSGIPYDHTKQNNNDRNSR